VTLTLPEDWREWPPAMKRRLLWQLLARKEQRAPGPHALCTVPEARCIAAIAEADRNGLTGEKRVDWLADRGHMDWLVWLILAGRGFGKTRSGAEEAAWMANSGEPTRGAVVAPTFADARDVCIEGESGLLACLPPGSVAEWNRSLGELKLKNGSLIELYSAEKPGRLRGPQHHWAWCDEVAEWQYLEDTWDMLVFGLRLGDTPRIIATTTPKPRRRLRDILRRTSTIVTRGSTYDNAANLAGVIMKEFRDRYEGTRLGRQELHAELLDEVEGALWAMKDIEDNRIPLHLAPNILELLGRVVVAIDPAVTSKATSDETGIAVAGLTAGPCPFCHGATEPHGVFLEDASGRFTPKGWADVAAVKYHRWKGDRIIGEVNNGGDLVSANLASIHPGLPFSDVHASRGKVRRAEPVAALYEKGKIHHLGANFATLEDQMTTWTDDDNSYSPDRMDALVWAFTELMVPKAPSSGPTRTVKDARARARR